MRSIFSIESLTCLVLFSASVATAQPEKQQHQTARIRGVSLKTEAGSASEHKKPLRKRSQQRQERNLGRNNRRPTTRASTKPPSVMPSQMPSQMPSVLNDMSSIQYIISEYYALQGGEEFKNGEDSYWVKALRYVEDTSETMPNWRLAQRYTLACIYYATNAVPTTYSDAMWAPGNTKNWLRPWAGDAYDLDGTVLIIDECSWPGVVCLRNGRVKELNLASNFVMGSIPPEIALLRKTLTVLDLEKNLVWNDGLDYLWWLTELTELRILSVGRTGFGYRGQGLPAEIFTKLTKLQELSVYSTLFLGPLNETIFTAMPDLEYLDLGALSFNSPLPSTLKNLAKLKFLYLDYADFTGTLDSFFDGNGFHSLEEIWIDDNYKLSGGIPATLGHYATIKSLSLTNCNLTGSLAEELGALTQMQQMWLSGNHFTGEIPGAWTNMQQLVRLLLQNNDLTGSMPYDICINTYGSLSVLGADCETPNPEVMCTCCTCCGDTCL